MKIKGDALQAIRVHGAEGYPYGSISYLSRARSTMMLRARLTSVTVRSPLGPIMMPQIS